ncbi:MAG: hypothetical protein NTV05_07595 [Acidobacteria bacterium]|nr:hypothetical protein [Acidobacteriota bacterium]
MRTTRQTTTVASSGHGLKRPYRATISIAAVMMIRRSLDRYVERDAGSPGPESTLRVHRGGAPPRDRLIERLMPRWHSVRRFRGIREEADGYAITSQQA